MDETDNSNDNKQSLFILYCKHDDLPLMEGDWTSHICDSINILLNEKDAVAAQKIHGLWIIGVLSDQSRSSLLQAGHFTVDTRKVIIYDHNPFAGAIKGPTIRVVVKDLPIYESDSVLLEYIKAHPEIQTNNVIHKSKSRINQGSSSFLNGDRFFYAKPDMDPPIPNKIQLGDHMCRVYYNNQVSKRPSNNNKRVPCMRCRKQDHYTSETFKCPAFVALQPSVISFTRGIFSNFSKCEVEMDGMTFKSSEHCYQWLAAKEALREDVAEAVFKASTPKEAKDLAQEIKGIIPNWKDLRCDEMSKVLSAKAKSSAKFKNELLETGSKILSEGLTDMYWGSGLTHMITQTTKPHFWPGCNMLGKLLMKLRQELRNQQGGAVLPEALSDTVTSATSTANMTLTLPQSTHTDSQGPSLTMMSTMPVDGDNTTTNMATYTTATTGSMTLTSGSGPIMSTGSAFKAKRRPNVSKRSKGTPYEHLRGVLNNPNLKMKPISLLFRESGKNKNIDDNVSVSSFGSFYETSDGPSRMDDFNNDPGPL